LNIKVVSSKISGKGVELDREGGKKELPLITPSQRMKNGCAIFNGFNRQG
jgi:hypothetical protein